MNPTLRTQNPTEDQPPGATNGAPSVVCASVSARHRYQAVQDQITRACLRVGRARQEVTLIAVSKTQSEAAIADVAKLGQQAFAENYLQEALPKIEALGKSEHILTWHFIGPIQSNKTKPIAENFSWVHSVDRLKIAQRLSEQRPLDLPDLQICLQVNISQESQKAGLSPTQSIELAQQVCALPRLRLRGLMCIPRPPDEADPDQDYQQMRVLLEQIRACLPAHCKAALNTLSMGMSADVDVAIAAGSTMVRIGTALFGPRQ